MRLISSVTLPLLALTLLPLSPISGLASGTVNQGLLPPGSAGDLVSDRGVPLASDGSILYVIVTSRALRPAFLELGRERIRNGIRSGIRSLESLESAYPSAVDDPDRIRQFLRDAHSVWGTQYVLLGGDTDVLPPRYVTTPSVLGERHFVSDWYFACLDGTWDADHDGRYGEAPDGAGDSGDQPDLVPELYVGRAPVSTPEEARRFVDRTIAYERRPADGFESTTLLFANRLQLGGPSSIDFAQMAEELLPLIADDPAQQVTRLYESFDDPAWVPGALPESPTSVVAALNRGANVAIGFGAGNEHLFEAGARSGPDPYLTVPNVLGLTNGDRVGHVFLSTALVGAFDTPTSLAEAFLKAEGGGAVTVLSPSDLTLVLQVSSYARQFTQVVFEEGASTIGEAMVRARAGVISPFSTIAKCYQLLGDPMLPIFSSSPVAEATGGHDPNGIASLSGSREGSRGTDVPIAIDPRGAATLTARGVGAGGAGRFALAQPVPSPCAGEARIACVVSQDLAGGGVDARILDLAGRAVRTIRRSSVPAGVTTLVWDLRDDQGARVSPGVYFVRATAGGHSQTRRLVVTSTP